MYKLLTPAKLTNKIRLLAYNQELWTTLLPEDEEFKSTNDTMNTLAILKKMTKHGFRADDGGAKGIETGVIKVNKETIAMGKIGVLYIVNIISNGPCNIS